MTNATFAHYPALLFLGIRNKSIIHRYRIGDIRHTRPHASSAAYTGNLATDLRRHIFALSIEPVAEAVGLILPETYAHRPPS